MHTESGGSSSSGLTGTTGATTTLDQDSDGYTPLAGDCDDLNPTIYPGVRELDDGLDNDCNGTIDNASTTPTDPNTDTDPNTVDRDRDGYSCYRRLCDDSNQFAFPGTVDYSNGIDDDCDGEIGCGLDHNVDEDGNGKG